MTGQLVARRPKTGQLVAPRWLTEQLVALRGAAAKRASPVSAWALAMGALSAVLIYLEEGFLKFRTGLERGQTSHHFAVFGSSVPWH